MKTMSRMLRMAALGILLPLAACSDLLTLDVEAPGRIADEDLNNPDAVGGLVVGMSFDLTDAVDATLQDVAIANGNLWHGGSYDFGTIPAGSFINDPEDWNGEYGSMSQARWVAENGLKRIARVLEPEVYSRNGDVARAYLLGGFANRLMGELQCRTTIDGGPDLPHTEHFNRADSLFSRAITIGQAAGRTDVVNAAYGGRASIRAWLGQWTQAKADAAQVPEGFSYSSIFSVANQNDLVYETHTRREFTVWGTMWVDYPDDPRVPWFIPLDGSGNPLLGQDGATLHYRQDKLTEPGDDVRLTHYAEMRVLLAEGALRNNEYSVAQGYLNQARDSYGMDPLTLSTDNAEAWATLRVERYAATWLENRRLWDQRRWSAEGGVMADPFSQGRDLCFPISDEEMRANVNVQALSGGCPTCGPPT
jgi:hypothetical protein